MLEAEAEHLRPGLKFWSWDQSFLKAVTSLNHTIAAGANFSPPYGIYQYSCVSAIKHVKVECKRRSSSFSQKLFAVLLHLAVHIC